LHYSGGATENLKKPNVAIILLKLISYSSWYYD